MGRYLKATPRHVHVEATAGSGLLKRVLKVVNRPRRPLGVAQLSEHMMRDIGRAENFKLREIERPGWP